MPFERGSREEIIAEISDLEQVLDDIKAAAGVTDDEVTAAKQAKFAKKGGFSAGVFVESIELNDDDEWAAYYRQEPEKYKEQA